MRYARDVAIIGGGVAGLSAAALLSRKGLKVRVLEANSKVGGCCATTNVDGYTFNDGAVYLAFPGLLDHVFWNIGLDRASELPVRRISRNQTTYLPDGTIVTIGEGLDIRIDAGRRAFNAGKLQDEIAAFAKRWEPVLRFFTDDILLSPFSASRLIAKSWRHLHKLRGTVASQLKASFSQETVRAAMSGALLYTGVPPEKMPAVLLIGLVAMLRDGLFLPEGGMGRIPEVLERAIRANGGETHLDSKVSRIVVRNGAVSGVETAHAGFIQADAVISTVSGMHTFGTLMDPGDVPARMARKVRRARLSHKGFVLQLGLRAKVEAPSHCLNVLPMMEGQSLLFMSTDEDDVRWPIYTVPTVTMPELAPPNTSIIEMFPPIPQDLPAEEWTEGRKEAVAEAAIRSLKRIHAFDVAAQRILSPKEHLESMHLYGAALYGLSPIGGPNTLFGHRSPIAGLYQAGQTTWPGFGVGAATMSGIFAARALAGTAAV